jgi:hypothetical protein
LTGINDIWDASGEIGQDVGSKGRGRAAGGIGRGSGERDLSEVNESPSDRVSWKTDGNGVEASGDDGWKDVRGKGKEESERARPEPMDEGEICGRDGGAGQEGAQHVEGGHMDNEWVVGRTTLSSKDSGDGDGVEGISGEAIDGFSGHGDDQVQAGEGVGCGLEGDLGGRMEKGRGS